MAAMALVLAASCVWVMATLGDEGVRCGLPPHRLLASAAASPARVRSWMKVRSPAARAPPSGKTIWPGAVAGSSGATSGTSPLLYLFGALVKNNPIGRLIVIKIQTQKGSSFFHAYLHLIPL
jgi:hypothetical protein